MTDQGTFNVMFAADWLSGRGENPGAVERWAKLERRLLDEARDRPEGRVVEVDRRRTSARKSSGSGTSTPVFRSS